MKIKTQEISFPLLKEKKIRLFIKRIDQIHKYISGNKWFKLKYNLVEAKKQDTHSILTFGGAYSNHIAATAAAGKQYGFHTIGFIRGEANQPLNPTLPYAVDCGMQLRYVSREDYRDKTSKVFAEKYLLDFSDCYLIPEKHIVKVESYHIIEGMADEGFLAGIKYDDNHLLIAVTEKRTKQELDKYVDAMKKVINE